jgi:nicotinamidase/pyrazinamidase
VTAAVLLVDPQNDFFPGGALPVADGDRIVDPVNALLARGLPVFVSRDWHPPSSKHFVARGGIWPPHCVQGTTGAAFRADLALPPDARVYSKGTNPEDDAGYSAFEGVRDGRALDDDLKAAGVDELIVAGLATDYCVKASVLDALARGYRVRLLADGVRAVEVKDGDGARALAAMTAAGATLI